MSDTTNLADLPTDPSAGGSQNIVLQTTDKPSSYDPNIGVNTTRTNNVNNEPS